MPQIDINPFELKIVFAKHCSYVFSIFKDVSAKDCYTHHSTWFTKDQNKLYIQTYAQKVTVPQKENSMAGTIATAHWLEQADRADLMYNSW